MESKIEQLLGFNYDGVQPEVVRIIEILDIKLQEVISYLNSQAQPEEKQTIKDIQKRHKEWKEWKIKHEQEALEQLRRFQYKPQENHIPATPDSWGREILKLDRRKQDTPEEWEEEIRSLIDGQQLKGVKPYTGDYERLVCAIKQLLTEREMRAYSDGYTDGITRCMNSLDKLNKKK